MARIEKKYLIKKDHENKFFEIGISFKYLIAGKRNSNSLWVKKKRANKIKAYFTQWKWIGKNACHELNCAQCNVK